MECGLGLRPAERGSTAQPGTQDNFLHFSRFNFLPCEKRRRQRLAELFGGPLENVYRKAFCKSSAKWQLHDFGYRTSVWTRPSGFGPGSCLPAHCVPFPFRVCSHVLPRGGRQGGGRQPLTDWLGQGWDSGGACCGRGCTARVRGAGAAAGAKQEGSQRLVGRGEGRRKGKGGKEAASGRAAGRRGPGEGKDRAGRGESEGVGREGREKRVGWEEGGDGRGPGLSRVRGESGLAP